MDTLAKTPSSADETPSLTMALAMQVIEQQIASIQYQQYSGFDGADQMSAATTAMQSAASGWPATKQAIQAAARAVIQGGPSAAGLASGACSTSDIAAALTGFGRQSLAPAATAYAQAHQQFTSFLDAITQAYDQGAGANTNAADLLQQAQMRLQADQSRLNTDEAKVRSAGSIVAAILTFGISLKNEMDSLNREIRSLNEESAQMSAEETAYAAALGSFQTALGAAKQASSILDDVNTLLQQLGNDIADITIHSSDIPAVMKAYLSQFQSEYANAVVQAQDVASL